MVAMKIPPRVERLDLPEPDEAAQKTADDRAGDADEDRNDNPAWVLPGHDELGDSPGNEAQKIQEKIPMLSLLGQIRRARKDLFSTDHSGGR